MIIKTKTVGARVEGDFYEEIQAYAEYGDMTVSEFVADAISCYMSWIDYNDSEEPKEGEPAIAFDYKDEDDPDKWEGVTEYLEELGLNTDED
jgi:hypothetical protein